MQLARKNISAIFLEVKIYQGRQLCDDKQGPSVLVNFKLTGKNQYKPKLGKI